MNVPPAGRVPVSSMRREREGGETDPLDAGQEAAESGFARAGNPPDPVNVLVEDFIKSCTVKPSDPASAANSLPELVSIRRWESVIAATNGSAAPANLDADYVAACRLEAMFRLKQYDELSIEIQRALSPLEEEVSTSVLSATQLDRWVSLRLLLAETKLLSGLSSEAFQALKDLSLRLSGFAEHNDLPRLRFWSWHVSCHTCNAYIRLRNWKAAVRLLRQLTLELDKFQATCANEEDKCDVLSCKAVLLCRASKLCLQVGAVNAATAHYEQASKILLSYSSLASDQYLQSHILLMQGLLAFGKDEFDKAMDFFSTLIDYERLRLSDAVSRNDAAKEKSVLSEGNPMVKMVRKVLWRPLDDSPLSAAVNNYAVCCLYLKRNMAAITKVEELLSLDPTAYMSDPVIFNLCTMYDLCYAPDISTNKKKALQRVAARYSIPDAVLHWRSFRLN